MQALIDTATREIKGYGIFGIAPEGQEVAELRDDQLPKLTERGDKFLGADGTINVVLPQWAIDADAAETQDKIDHAAIRALVVSAAQTAVGVSLANLTAAQVRALMAILLYQAGGVTPDGKVRPLGQWAK